MPRVSVLIPSYNCAQYLSAAIDSVLSQTYSDLEVIIIDDGSTDMTQELVKDYQQNPRVKYIYQTNKGLAAARNTGVRQSQGEYIALLDADDYWEPAKLERQIAVLEKNKSVGLVHSNMFVFYDDSPDKKIKYSLNVDFNRMPKEKLFMRLLTFQAELFVPTLIMRKSIFDSIGFFDENLSYLGCEDRDFCLRVARKLDTYFLSDYLASYRLRRDSMSKNKPKMEKAREYLIEKTVNETDFFTNKTRIKQVIISALYLRLGMNCLREVRFRESIYFFWHSIKNNYLNLKAYFLIVLGYAFSPFEMIIRRRK